MDGPPAPPITHIRVQVISDPGGLLLSSGVQAVDPAAGAWTMTHELEMPDGTARLVRVTAELLSGSGATEAVEWSGRSAVVRVTPGSALVAELTFYRGPLQNLTLTGLTVQPDTAVVVEGDSLPLTAVLLNAAAGARVFWVSRDTAVATVDAAGVVHGQVAGRTRIVALAGALADSSLVIAVPRLASIEVSPDSVVTGSLGDTAAYTARVFDIRGNPVPGVPLTWSVVDAGVAESLGGGLFRSASAGRTLVRATTPQAPGLAGQALLVARQQVAQLEIAPASASLNALGATVHFTATARDAHGRPIPAPAFVWSSSDPSVAFVTSAGLATSLTAGQTQITVTLGGLSASAPLSVQPATASVGIEPAGATLTALGAAQTFRAVVADANGNTIEGVACHWTSSDPMVVDVDSAGVARAVSSGSATVTADCQGLRASVPVTVSQAVASLRITGDSSALPALQAQRQWSVVALDGLGTPVPQTGTWQSSDTTIARVDASGRIVAVGNGTATIFATVGAVTIGRPITVAQVPASLAVAEGNGQSGAAGAELAQALGARVRDANGYAIAGVQVGWTVAAGGGSAAAHSTTDAAGVARVAWTLGTAAGADSLEASVTGLTPITFAATALPGAASRSRSTLTANPTSIAADGSATSTITVRLKDGYDNALTGSGGTVTLSATGGSLSAVTDHADGTYTATLTAPTSGDSVAISGELDGGALADTAIVTLLAGTPAKLVITGNDTQTAGTSQTITITAQDADGHTVAGYAGGKSLTFSGAHAIGGSTPSVAGTELGSATSLTFTGGVATASLILYRAETAIIDATDGSLSATGADRLSVTVTPGEADSLVLITQPAAGAQSGVVLTRQPVVELRDASGNAVPQAHTEVTASIATGAGTLGGTLSLETDAAGRASFTDLVITGSAGTRTLAFTATGLGTATSDGVVVATLPGQPGTPTPTAGDGQVALTWSAPADDGSSLITDYDVEYQVSGSDDWQHFGHTASSDTSATVTGLVNGTAYDFRVSAVNGIGTGSASPAATATPRGVPGTPTDLSLTPASGQVALTWTAPAGNGGSPIIDYLVEWKTSASGTWSSSQTAAGTSSTVSGLSNGTSYDFRVSARNVVGTGTPAGPATLVLGVPGAPTALTVVTSQTGTTGLDNQQQAALSWTAPAYIGSSALTDYVIEYRPSTDVTWTTVAHTASTATTFTVPGLVNSTTYVFRVSAKNAVGTGAPSAPATQTTTGPSNRLACLTPGSSNSSASSGSVQPCADVQAGNIIVVPIVLANTSRTTPYAVTATGANMGGWTELGTTLDGSSQTTVLYKIADANDVNRAASYTFSWGTNKKWAVTLVAYRDVGSAVPQFAADTGTSQTAAAPQISVAGPLSSYTMLYVFGTQARMSSTTASIGEWTSTQDVYRETTAGANNNNSVAVLTADLDIRVAGTSPPRTAMTANMTTASNWSAWTIVLRP